MAHEKDPLKLAIGGSADTLTEKQAKGALAQAVSQITSLSKIADSSKEALLNTGTRVLHVTETQGSLFLASMAEGYLGAEKLKLGGVDMRAPLGLLAQGYGLYDALSGKSGGGDHALAVGNGITGSWLASVGVEAGKTLAKKQEPAPAKAPAAPQQTTTPSMQGLPQPAWQPAYALPPGPAPAASLQGPLVQVPAYAQPASSHAQTGHGFGASNYSPTFHGGGVLSYAPNGHGGVQSYAPNGHGGGAPAYGPQGQFSGPAPQPMPSYGAQPHGSSPRYPSRPALMPEPPLERSDNPREIRLTPPVQNFEDAPDEVAGPVRRNLRRANAINRFPRAEQGPDQDLMEEDG